MNFKGLFIAALATFSLNSYSGENKMASELMIEKQQVVESVVKMVNAIDTKQWLIAQGQFSPTVFVDYSSMNNQAGANTKASDLVSGWQNLLKTVDTHHMLTNFEVQIDGNEAKMQSHVYASHLAQGIEYWDIFGRYLHTLEKTNDGWKIKSMTLIVHGQKGNTDFIAQVLVLQSSID